MSKQRIIELRDEIARLENELATEQEAYMAEATADGILTEDFGEYRFQIQPNPPALDVDKNNVPDFLQKLSIDQSAVRKYLGEHGQQPWGALRDDKPYKLVVKRIPLKADLSRG